MPRGNNSFETACLGVFAIPGTPKLRPQLTRNRRI